jgi:hypothetical protein
MLCEAVGGRGAAGAAIQLICLNRIIQYPKETNAEFAANGIRKLRSEIPARRILRRKLANN